MEEYGSGSTPRVRRLARGVVWELITVLLPALAITLLLNAYVVGAVEVEDGPSMQPNLYEGYRVITEKVSYRFHAPRRGDIVIAARPGQEWLIKRAMALPGEVVEVRGGHTYIDGLPVEEPWVTYFGGPDYPPTMVPPDHVFILGDSRGSSRDSRLFGPVPLERIKGHAWMVYWPLDEIKLLR